MTNPASNIDTPSPPAHVTADGSPPWAPRVERTIIVLDSPSPPASPTARFSDRAVQKRPRVERGPLSTSVVPADEVLESQFVFESFCKRSNQVEVDLGWKGGFIRINAAV
ncbi:hypothetical protein BC939DRAFT_489110 [Gamsiella multidivaricata]|uniref:uncharacterized protein n=1 Tax=Gamsiella multidivaricata TaxID=101098 RepID=UPI002220211E|nr:uncharacterized protein BC939DRAFT_489110 [Gamsiella multidivaricata]KAI7831795.1 hypothetical protein BC939DRAFT_489110 [Gamsiella multidivaricata]